MVFFIILLLLLRESPTGKRSIPMDVQFTGLSRSDGLMEEVKTRQLRFAFDGRKLVAISRHTTLEITVQDWTEIGVEMIRDNSLRLSFCLVINRRTHNLRVPDDAPVFKALLDYFPSLEGFDWQPLVNPSAAY